jgi:hypothetical protein
MLHFANLVATLDLPAPTGAAIDPAAAALRAWAATAAAAPVLREWGDDFADAVRLHIQSTSSLSELLVRSASARDALPGSADNPSEDDWTTGSWRQRALALLFGGDPLDPIAPGIAPRLRAEDVRAARDWPSRQELTYASHDLWSPAVLRVLALARLYDAMSFVLRDGVTEYSGPEDIDVVRSGAWIYRDIEAALRSAACAPSPDAPTVCRDITGADVLEPLPSDAMPSDPRRDSFRLWTHHQLRPSDAQALVLAMVDLLPSPKRAGGVHIVGPTRLERRPGRASLSLVFDAETELAPQPLVQLAGVFGAYGRHRLPTSLGAGSANGHGVAPLFSPGADALEASRRLGAMPALGLVRRLLVRHGDSSNPMVKAALHKAIGVRRAIEAAIGQSSIHIAPMEVGATGTGGGLRVAHATRAEGTHAWSVAFEKPGGDAFYDVSGGTYVLVALTGEPAAAQLLSDPISPRAGFPTLAALAARPAVARVGTLTRGPDGGFSGEIDLTDGAEVVLAVGRRVGRRYEYRPLTGSFRPMAQAGAQAVPVDGFELATDGYLGTLASKIVTLRPSDPSWPAFDGFGLAYDRVPERSHETHTFGSSLGDFSQRWLSIATASEVTARELLRDALRDLRDNKLAEVDVAATRSRQLGVVRSALMGLCGSAARTAGSLVDLEAQSAEAACGVSTVRTSVLGFTPEEYGRTCGALGAGAPPARVAVSWATDIDCAEVENANAEAEVKCTLLPVFEELDFAVDLPAQVACTAQGDSVQSFAPVGGALAQRMVAQRNALRAYHDRVRELEAAGRLVIIRARAADNARAAADAGVQLAKMRAALAEREGLMKLADLSRAVERAADRVRGAEEYFRKLTGKSAKEWAKATSSSWGTIAAAGMQGARIGSKAGPQGGAVVAIGAAAAAAAPVIINELFGPSDEEVQAAQNAIDEARLAEAQARKAEQEYASYVGLCQKDAGAAANDPKAGSWGACPPGTFDQATVLGVYAQETLVSEANASLAATQATVAVREAALVLREKFGLARDAARALGTEIQALSSDLEKTQIALAEARLEADVVATRGNAIFGISRAFHANSLWEAQGKIETARRNALDARRAVEFAYATNLSSITATQSKVGAPTLWADQVYDYDLSPIRVAGLSSGRPSPAAISEQKLNLYVRNLTSFTEGVLAERKVLASNSGHNALAVIPGPAARIRHASDPWITYPDPLARSWQVLCPQKSDCAPSGGFCMAARDGQFNETCKTTAPDGSVTYPAGRAARITFILDAWGRFDQRATEHDRDRLLNGRWDRFVINLKGFDKRDCSRLPPTEQRTCWNYSNHIPFTLRHMGPFAVLDERMRLQSVPMGPISVSGNATVEVQPPLDRVLSSFGVSPLSEVRRTELWGYPLGGVYELRFDTPPDKDLAAIEAVEILTNAMYWQPER